jgi:hypothetical protein
VLVIRPNLCTLPVQYTSEITHTYAYAGMHKHTIIYTINKSSQHLIYHFASQHLQLTNQCTDDKHLQDESVLVVLLLCHINCWSYVMSNKTW